MSSPHFNSVQDSYNGWLDEQSVVDFAAYAAVCFKAFGDRVKHWTTFNEPLTFVFQGYATGQHAPGASCCSRCLLCGRHTSTSCKPCALLLDTKAGKHCPTTTSKGGGQGGRDWVAGLPGGVC